MMKKTSTALRKENVNGKATKSVETTQLDKTAWLRAAAIAIAEDGFNGTRILPLSKRLGVTRGSFYWHFADHAAFVQAFIIYWRDQQLRAVEVFTHESNDPVEAYARLLDMVLTDTGVELKRLKVEFALRGYARRDAFAAKAVAAVDQARTQLFIPIVEGIAETTAETESFAHLLLAQLSGAQHAIAGPNCNGAVLAGMKQAMLSALAALHATKALRSSAKSSAKIKPQSRVGKIVTAK
jgi:AcrR family transcriptional regulator